MFSFVNKTSGLITTCLGGGVVYFAECCDFDRKSLAATNTGFFITEGWVALCIDLWVSQIDWIDRLHGWIPAYAGMDRKANI